MRSRKFSGSDLVYGDLPSWYELTVKTNIERAKKLHEYLLDTKQNLLTGYISYVLARADYDNITIIDMDPFEENDQVETSKFTLDDLVKQIDAFNCREEYKYVEDNDWLYEMYSRANARA